MKIPRPYWAHKFGKDRLCTSQKDFKIYIETYEKDSREPYGSVIYTKDDKGKIIIKDSNDNIIQYK